MEGVNPEASEFLVRINSDYFLAGIDGKTVTGTPVPSAGLLSPYIAAAKLCARLRATGYPVAHVTDMFGAPITLDRLQQPVSVTVRTRRVSSR